MLYRMIIIVFVVTLVMMADARLAGRIKEEEDTEASKKWPKWLRWLHLEDGLKSMFVQIGNIYKGDKYAWIIALALSITALFPSFFGKASLYLLISELAAMVLIAFWWHGFKVKGQWVGGGDEWKEMIWFIILELFFAVAAYVVALALGKLTLLPKLFLVGTIGFFIFDKYHGVKNLRRIVAGLTLAAMIVTTGFAADVNSALNNALSKVGVTSAKIAEDAAETVVTTAEAADDADANDTDEDTEAEWHFYNNDVQGGNEDDDFNFGPPLEGDTADELDSEFRARIEKDPALGAAAAAWVDCNLGTRYLGEFYQSCKGDWAKTINSSKDKFIKDSAMYGDTRESLFELMNVAEVSVESGEILEDQMYMNPFVSNANGSPDVIVMKTKDHKGKFLVYTWKIKGNKVSVAFRTECGGQPTDVGEKMDITPEEPTSPNTPSNPPNNPDNPSTPGKGDNPGTPDKPDKPSTPKYKKDKTKGTQGEKVKKGEKDKNTNNPSNPNQSKADTKDSTSNSGKSYEDTKKDVQNKKDTNANQNTGGGSSQPSTPAPKPDTKQDNNGSKVDKPTGKSGGTAEGQKNDGQISTPD